MCANTYKYEMYTNKKIHIRRMYILSIYILCIYICENTCVPDLFQYVFIYLHTHIHEHIYILDFLSIPTHQPRYQIPMNQAFSCTSQRLAPAQALT